jgi:hypothetical protein
VALTLDDIMNMPQDPELQRQHLTAIGAIPQPPAPPPPEKVGAMTPPVAPKPTPFTAPTHFDRMESTREGTKEFGGPSSITLNPGVGPTIPAKLSPIDTSAPDVGSVATTAPEQDSISQGVQPMKPPTLNFHQRQALPTFSSGVQVNSPEFFQNQIERIEDQKANPLGSAENMPGAKGHILHILGKIGNVAGDIVAPATLANIPGTELNRQDREANLEAEEGKAQERETAKELATEKTRHEMTLEDQATQKIDQLQQKIDETNRHNLSTEDAALRKRGLMRDPNDPTKQVPVPEDQLSDDEKAALELKQAGAHQKEAAALVNQLKADPNSPQNQQVRERLKIMAQNAGTAAARVGLSRAEYLRDTLGLDEQGNPLPGISYDENGKPIGTKVRAGNSKALSEFNKNFEKPAEDKELSFKQMDKAYNEYKDARARGEELPTGAQSMVALSNHLSTTFGNVRGARITKDMIHEHLGARGISDSALVAIQRLTNGDALSPAQWNAFHDLVSDARRNAWQEAGKEAVRADLPVDFLPDELANDTAFTNSFKTNVVKPGQAPTRKTGETAPPKWAPPKDAPSAQGVPDNKVLKDSTGAVIAVAKGGQWQEPNK